MPQRPMRCFGSGLGKPWLLHWMHLFFVSSCRATFSVAEAGTGKVLYLFEDYALDSKRRELRHKHHLLSVEPKVFDLLLHLVSNRERVVSKDDLVAAIWNGRIVSDSALTSCINAARSAV